MVRQGGQGGEGGQGKEFSPLLVPTWASAVPLPTPYFLLPSNQALMLPK